MVIQARISRDRVELTCPCCGDEFEIDPEALAGMDVVACGNHGKGCGWKATGAEIAKMIKGADPGNVQGD